MQVPRVNRDVTIIYVYDTLASFCVFCGKTNIPLTYLLSQSPYSTYLMIDRQGVRGTLVFQPSPYPPPPLKSPIEKNHLEID